MWFSCTYIPVIKCNVQIRYNLGSCKRFTTVIVVHHSKSCSHPSCEIQGTQHCMLTVQAAVTGIHCSSEGPGKYSECWGRAAHPVAPSDLRVSMCTLCRIYSVGFALPVSCQINCGAGSVRVPSNLRAAA